ncbi:MAG: DUF1214 domain-containing protein [Acidimicrobiales bacterium]|nr:DUF1214 domain-containing protein [Acidimicrobiales bacterium]
MATLHSPLSEAAYRDFLTAAAELTNRWADVGLDAHSELDGYRWAMSLIGVANDVFVFADPLRPRFQDIVGPYRKFNGDNVDAFYQFAPIDPARTYRVRGRMGDAVYLSLTVYGTALDAETEDRVVHTDRIVAIVNDRDLDIADDGTFEIVLSPEPHDGNWIELTPESVCAITRDYVNEPRTARRVEWHIEAVDEPRAWRDTDAELAARFTAAARWLREHARSFPSPLGPPNEVLPPYPVPAVTTGWAAGDAAYAMGAFQLGDDEALVIRGRSPECRFWNLCIWNQFIVTYNYDYDEPVSINGSQVTYERDGSWTIVVAPTDTGHPNWLSTAGHSQGKLWFRWFYPSGTPDAPTCEVVPLGQAPTSI